MTPDLYNWSRVREGMLEELFATPDLTEAAAIAGLLFDFRVVFSAQVQKLTETVEGSAVVSMRPYELEEAADCVARLYGLSYPSLVEKLKSEWSQIKRSDAFTRVRQSVEGHRFVDHIEPYGL